MHMKSVLSWCTISSARAKESFTVSSLYVIEESLRTKNFVSLWLGVPIAEIIGLNGGQTLVMAFYFTKSIWNSWSTFDFFNFLKSLGRQTSWFLKSLQIIVNIFFMVNWQIQNSFLDANFFKLIKITKNGFHIIKRLFQLWQLNCFYLVSA